MRTIWKYELAPLDEQVLMIPGAVPLSVGAQGGRHSESLVLWSIVDDEGEPRRVHVCVRGTGHDLFPSDGKFLGTAQMSSGLVFHVFVYVT